MSISINKSQELLKQAEALLPGGVNSPVRAFRSVGGSPLFIEKAKGAYLTDVDGNAFVDLVGTWGPAILGHAHDTVIDAICAAARKGTSFGAPTAAEVTMAQRIQRFFPSMEMMRMVSSGTEACMSALRLARGVTKRDKIVKFEGCYHGHADSLLVKAGSGAASFGVPDSAGIPADLAKHTLTLAYNDAKGLRELFATQGDQIACVILEAVTGNMGVVLPTSDFVQALKEVKSYGALVIFDEVMSGWRVHQGGAQAHLGFDPDLTCLGKVVGGGLPVGVYGGKAEYMRMISPLGPVYQAGTLSGNPLATAAGIATLTLLEEEGLFERVFEISQKIADGLKQIIAQDGHQAIVQHLGSMITVFFTDKPAVMNFDDAKACDHKRFGRFHQAMLQEGVYLPPSGYEAWFVSAAHTQKEVDHILKAAQKAFLA